MPPPSDSSKSSYMFTDDIKFLQKAVVMHPVENKFLAIKRSMTDTVRPGKWDLIGGNVHFGEKHDEALKREIMEETNLKTEDLIPILVLTNFENNNYYLFIGYKTQAIDATVLLSEEHTEFKWVTKEEFLKLDCGTDFLYTVVNKL